MSSRSIEPSGSNRRQVISVRTNQCARTERQKPHGSRYRGDQDDSPEGRNPSRPSGQASHALFLHSIFRRFDQSSESPDHSRLGLLGSPDLAPLARGYRL